MKYVGQADFRHQKKPLTGVLITNLGTPERPDAKALRVYLKEFLSDPRVVEAPRLLWWFVLRVILLIRPKRSAKSYQKIWTKEGSPLAVHTRQQAVALQSALGTEIVVDWAMRYGQPSIRHTVEGMLDKGVRKLLVLPLYPQYSASTGASTFDAIAKCFSRLRWIPGLRFVEGYHNDPGYIEAVANAIQAHWSQFGRADKLIFTYHGVPLRFLHNGDPYHCHCYNTTRLVAERLELKQAEYLTCFQSRFGREPWLQPYTDKTLVTLAQQGIKKVQLVCPGFSSDCLETLEEIAMENKHYFLDAGGEAFEYIPALNSSAGHIAFLKSFVLKQLAGWDIPDQDIALQSSLAEQLPHNQK